MITGLERMFVLAANMPLMGTAPQNEANRRNAKKSTGPRSKAGKAVSAANALRHGAYASTAMAIPRGRFAEDQADVDTYVEGIVRALMPRDDLELAQANRIARYFLQYRRLGVLEAEALAGDTSDESGLELLATMDRKSIDELGKERAAFKALDSALEKVTRIDARIGRSLERAIIVFYELQKRDLESHHGETNPILGSGV